MEVLNWQVKPFSQGSNQLWQDWHALFQLYHSENPMLDRRFVSSLIHYYPADIYVALGRINQDIAAILLIEKIAPGRWKNYLPSQSQVSLTLVKSGVDFNLGGLMSRLGICAIKLDIFSLDPQEHQSIINNVASPQLYAQNIKLRIAGSFDDYWHARPKRLRKDITKSLNRLTKDNIQISYNVVDNKQNMSDAINRYGMLEIQGWKGRNGTAIHPANTQGQFYNALLLSFAQNKHALVFESYIDEQLVASRLCIRNEQTLIILKTTFDENYSHYGLGKLNRYKLIEYLFARQYTQCVDFYTHASKEQVYWSTEQRPMYNASFYRFKAMEKGICLLKKYKVKDAD